MTLAADIADMAGEIFADEYETATLNRVTTTDDAQGRQTRTTAGQDVLVQVDRLADQHRRAEGSTPRDVSIIMLTRAPDGADVAQPGIHDSLLTSAGLFRLSLTVRDAARSHWFMRGTPTSVA